MNFREVISNVKEKLGLERREVRDIGRSQEDGLQPSCRI